MLCDTFLVAALFQFYVFLNVSFATVSSNANINAQRHYAKKLHCWRCKDSGMIDSNAKTFIKPTTKGITACATDQVACLAHEHFCISGYLKFNQSKSSDDQQQRLPKLRRPIEAALEGEVTSSATTNEYIINGCYGDSKLNRTVVEGARCETYPLNFTTKHGIFPSITSFCICKGRLCNDNVLFQSYKAARSWMFVNTVTATYTLSPSVFGASAASRFRSSSNSALSSTSLLSQRLQATVLPQITTELISNLTDELLLLKLPNTTISTSTTFSSTTPASARIKATTTAQLKKPVYLLSRDRGLVRTAVSRRKSGAASCLRRSTDTCRKYRLFAQMLVVALATLTLC